ncbi:MAG: tagaturonate reductase [Clostridia bacterium]|nr:tagaturonate reductase [Clostridia bacterium]
MQRLSRQMLADAGVVHTPSVPRPERVLQFGEGGFLRAFVDQMLDAANECGAMNVSVIVVQPIPRGLCAELDAQDGLYTLIRRGKVGGRPVRDVRIITALSRTVNPYAHFAEFLRCAHNPELRFIVSNTTEAGIVYTGLDSYADAPPASFPGKLTRLMHERFLRFGGEPGKGFVLLPCELIDANGDALREAVLRTARQWRLDSAFIEWIENENVFANTLVDRIVTGYPRAEAEALQRELGYEDRLIDVAEPFGLWVIEGPELAAELPLHRAGQNVVFAADVGPYKLRKVRMLNGAHTATALAAYLAGLDTVGECLADPIVRAYMERALRREIMPTLTLPAQELEDFAGSLFERFENPFNRHELLSIALNSVSKFRARVLPTIKEYQQRYGKLPAALTFSMAALLAFYRVQPMEGGYFGRRGDRRYRVIDEEPALRFFAGRGGLDAAALARDALANADLWGEDLAAIPGFARAVAGALRAIEEDGARAAMRDVAMQEHVCEGEGT